jgi:hypothetical protein
MAERDPITGEGVEGDLEKALKNPRSTGEFIGLSMILDVLNLHGGNA